MKVIRYEYILFKMNIEKEVADRIKKMLAEQGKSQRQMAINLHMKPMQLWRALNGKISLKVSLLEQIAQYLKAPPERFFANNKPKKK